MICPLYVTLFLLTETLATFAPRVWQIIKKHHKKIINRSPRQTKPTCNYRANPQCPLNANCLQNNTTCQATVKSIDNKEKYWSNCRTLKTETMHIKHPFPIVNRQTAQTFVNIYGKLKTKWHHKYHGYKENSISLQQYIKNCKLSQKNSYNYLPRPT